MPSKRTRDYKQEYQRRKLKARKEGFSSPYHKTQVRKEAKKYHGQIRDKYVEFSKSQKKRKNRDLWNQGLKALQQKDHDKADRIARRLGVKNSATLGPPSRIFWYHE